ncbi:hypothetical protein [Streptomyces malaysiensis]|uniref:hypothetical protein n=1 Tax=Streptomyces malaysiensis TaxID=92644 RepID=UPI002B3152A1|nr:hypothetical protein R8789_45400 [Streptomyces malaysiensis]
MTDLESVQVADGFSVSVPQPKDALSVGAVWDALRALWETGNSLPISVVIRVIRVGVHRRSARP